MLVLEQQTFLQPMGTLVTLRRMGELNGCKYACERLLGEACQLQESVLWESPSQAKQHFKKWVAFEHKINSTQL